MAWEEYRDTTCHCREKICGAKAHLGLGLAGTAGDNKKSFFKYVNGNRQCKNDIGPLQDEDGHLANRHMDKTGVFSAFFGSLFNMDNGPREFQCPEMVDHDCVND